MFLPWVSCILLPVLILSHFCFPTGFIAIPAIDFFAFVWVDFVVSLAKIQADKR